VTSPAADAPALAQVPLAGHTAALVQADAVTVAFHGRHVAGPLTLAVLGGDRVALTGRSGSGKTSLLLALAGQLTPASGTVDWPGLSADRRERARQVALVLQAPSLLPDLTAAENVALPLRLAGWSRIDAGRATRAALDLLLLPERACGALPADLSGGQQQRVACARALAGGPDLLLADEPTGAQDSATGAAVVAALLAAQSRPGCALVVATHDPEVAAALPLRWRLDAPPDAPGDVALQPGTAGQVPA